MLVFFRTSSFGKQAATLCETELCTGLTLLNLSCQGDSSHVDIYHLRMAMCPTYPRVLFVCSCELRCCLAHSPMNLLSTHWCSGYLVTCMEQWEQVMIKMLDSASSMRTILPPSGSSTAHPVRLGRVKPAFCSPARFSAYNLDTCLPKNRGSGWKVRRLLRVLGLTISLGSP